MRRKRVVGRLIAAGVAVGLLMYGGPILPASAAGGPNLALGKATAASGHNDVYVQSNINDGNQASYWEGVNNSFPQWAQVDLGSTTTVDQVVLKIPNGWGARTETLAIQGSTDGTSFTTIVGSAGYAFNGSSNSVTVNFPANNTRFVRLNVTANSGWTAAQISELEIYGVTGSSPNLAQGKTMTASGFSQTYTASNANDGNQASYWESTNNAFPQWLQVDLGATVSVNKVVLKLPAGWGTRDETLTVQSSANGSTFSNITASTAYTFNPANSNVVTINFNATSTRYVRLTITANSQWPAAQLSEFEVYGPTTGDTQAPTAPANLAFTQPASGQIRLTWSASTDNVGVTGYDIYANNVLRSSVAAGVLTYTDSQPDGTTVAYYVRAKDAAGNQSSNSNTVTRTGTSTDTQAPTAPGNLAYTQPASGQIRLTWSASTDNVGVTGYDIYANNALRASVGAGVLTYTDNQPDTATVAYYVKAKDAAGNQSSNSNTVTRTGTSTDTQAPTAPGNLAYTQPASGQIRLTWSASSDNVAVTGYDIYANSALRASVAAGVLTYTDSQPDTATVSYYVKAKDAAGNQSANSNTVTRTGSGTGGSNLAIGKPVTASGSIFTFVPTNANDNSVTTYWEANGGAFPNTLTISLGANAVVNSIVLKLNPDAAWSTRTQRIEVQAREQSSSTFTTIKAAADYVFNPASGANTAVIPVTTTAADFRLNILSNTGSGGGQVAEFQIIGTPAPNPDLTVTGSSWSPANPVETDTITATATVRNAGTAASPATAVRFYLGTTLAGSANVGTLAAGASVNVSASLGTRDAGSYQLTVKVDEPNTVIELDDANNSFTNSSSLVVQQVPSSDLVASSSSWSPSNPAAGNTVTFSVAIRNQGTLPSAGGAHGVTLTVTDTTSGSVVKTLTGSYTGVIAAGATTPAINLGTWTAVNGKYSVKVVVAVDSAELPVKQANNTTTTPFFVGRGANMPYDMYEAEDGVVGGGAGVIGPNRTVGDLAGEASGRKAVTLNSNGSFVEFTTKASTNTLVTRFSIPDSAGGGGTNSTLNIYVNNTFLKAIDLSSKYAWLYGNETGPGNSPGAGGPRHIYDEANVLLGTTVPVGSKIKLQKDAANSGTFAIDFINLEQVSPIANPDPTKYTVPAGFTQQDVQNALDRVRQDANLLGVYLPAGDYQVSQKLRATGKAMKVVGAGPWYTRFYAPSGQENSDVGIDTDASANGSTFSGFAYFGNYTSRIDGPGKVFNFGNVSNMTIDNVWVEHMICMYWGANTDFVTIKNSRIRDTFADGINMTNGSTDNHVINNESRSTGDDSFALFSAIDAGGADEKNNIFENLTSLLTWRAAGIAVYGGYANTFRNIYIADTLVYSGITISSLDFGYAMNGFGASPTTDLQNISIVRAGGHFWGSQTFPGIWVFSASKVFQGIRVSDVDIIDPTYAGIMFQTNYVGSTPQFPVKDTIFTNITITGAQRSGDAFNAKSGLGIWANESAEPGQGPAVGSVVFNHLTMTNNAENIRNTTSTFTITVNP